jgi:DNA invertase Pin-like site-specific DNA recombinase
LAFLVNNSVHNTKRKIGYARVSSPSQNLDRQLGPLRAERCYKIFHEKASGKDVRGRAQLKKAIDALGRGDVLIIAEWDRATRSMQDGLAIVERVHARGAMIKVLDKPHLHLTTSIGRGFIAFLSALAEDERHRILKRANEGRAAARKRGVRMGRRPKRSQHQQDEAKKRLAAGDTCGAIARTFGVHHATIGRLA